MLSEVIDFVKNGDVWMMPDDWQLPDLNKNPRGGRMPIALAPPTSPKKTLEYISFERAPKSLPKKGCALAVGRKRNKQRRKGTANPSRAKAWLISSTRQEMAGRSTALSQALNQASIRALEANSIDPWGIVAPVLRKGRRRPPEAILGPIEERREVLVPEIPLTRRESWILYKDGWCLKADGTFIRTGFNIPPEGHLHSIRAGDCVKTPSYLKDAVEPGSGEVRCG